MKLILDTNLLILYLVGYYDKSFITQCKITREFTIQDYKKILNILETYNEILVTPQILAEVSNLSERINEPKFSEYMNSLIIKLSTLNEEYIPMSEMIKKDKILISLGFTDLSIIEVSKKYKCLILTKDFDLFQIAQYEGCNAINYAHLIDL